MTCFLIFIWKKGFENGFFDEHLQKWHMSALFRNCTISEAIQSFKLTSKNFRVQYLCNLQQAQLTKIFCEYIFNSIKYRPEQWENTSKRCHHRKSSYSHCKQHSTTKKRTDEWQNKTGNKWLYTKAPGKRTDLIQLKTSIFIKTVKPNRTFRFQQFVT